jgi:hypothetical protein
MKMLFWIGLAVLILGVASLVVPIPHNESDGFKVGGLSVGVETEHSEKLPPMLGGVMILAGAGMMIAGKRRG